MRDIAVLSKECGIQKVMLFGSSARGTHTDKSDIDIAISGGNTAEFSFAIDEKVHSLLMFDVVDLDGHISEELQKEIERDGIVIYEKIDNFSTSGVWILMHKKETSPFTNTAKKILTPLSFLSVTALFPRLKSC